MKVLKLKLFQETACYKKPFAFKVGETYPLPPYSTVKGMLHKILKVEEGSPPVPMRISIQGNYESKFVNYQSMYFFKPNETTKMPLNIHLLYNVQLIIHVDAVEEVLNRIVEGLKNLEEHLSLGRKEDLVRIDEVKYVEVKSYDPDLEGESFIIQNPIYIPVDSLPSDVDGINYRLNWKYNVVNGLRQWDKIDVKYVEEGTEITDEVQVDNDGEPGDLIYFNTTLI
ncbi:type I-B CRISPR-associated protein Cas5b [Geosporobacter ferrireducens]|uniref:Type I-B CRISPR-associated protein Cas5 n=1 Tax=Geosporobacter ferrireducens TaxID=1424294 RepID=A0A1D8GIY0_9FIRM|nr:type I-B CRISPR-associated protein Cas5b [Geosporobacter ferrireducens]AOT70858.1 type I-B CRISPR-associated protein Cas5 [Geosporobacter ferrireducens]